MRECRKWLVLMLWAPLVSCGRSGSVDVSAGTTDAGTPVVDPGADARSLDASAVDLPAEAGRATWAASWGTAERWEEAYALAVDTQGNIYIVGWQAENDEWGEMVVVKLAPDGRVLWTASATLKGGGGFRQEGKPTGIAVDSQGNCYVTGFLGTYWEALFGTTTLTTGDIFVAKLDSSGKWDWAVSADTNPRFDPFIAVDSQGSCFVAGRFEGRKAHIGSTQLTTYYNSTPGLFVAKLDNAGQWAWVVATKQYSTSDDNLFPMGIAVDSESNCYVAGNFEGTKQFGSTKLTASGDRSLFVAKLDSNGSWQWAIAPDVQTWRGRIAVDGSGHAVIAGSFRQTTLRFGTTNLTGQGAYNLFAAKLDSDGNWLWAVDVGSSMVEENWFSYSWGRRDGVWVDDHGDTHIAGNFRHPLRLGVMPLMPSNGVDVFDVFVAELDSDGKWKTAATLGVPESALFVDGDGAYYGAGSFEGTETIGPTVLTASKGDWDMFVWKVAPLCQETPCE